MSFEQVHNELSVLLGARLRLLGILGSMASGSLDFDSALHAIDDLELEVQEAWRRADSLLAGIIWADPSSEQAYVAQLVRWGLLEKEHLLLADSIYTARRTATLLMESRLTQAPAPSGETHGLARQN